MSRPILRISPPPHLWWVAVPTALLIVGFVCLYGGHVLLATALFCATTAAIIAYVLWAHYTSKPIFHRRSHAAAGQKPWQAHLHADE